MENYQECEIYRDIDDIVSILEHHDITDIAYLLVKECPDIADKLSLAIGFELMDKRM